ncbi:MAG: biopolymer transporter ExbD [Planctomycetota bacterium]
MAAKHKRVNLAIIVLTFCLSGTFSRCEAQVEADNQAPAQQELIETVTDEQVEQAVNAGVNRLIELQHEDGAWPYEGVYRVRGRIPVGYRIGGTAIVCEAIMYGASADSEPANEAIGRGVDLIIEEMKNPLMQPSTRNTYDVRVWGHIYALDFFCRLLHDGRFADREEALREQVSWLTAALLTEQLDDGGWNYAGRDDHAPFVTAPAVQALLWAADTGEEVDPAVFANAVAALNISRGEGGAMAYSGESSGSFMNRLPGSIARTAASEFAIHLTGEDRSTEIAEAIDHFHTHWDELEKRRKQTGTHVRPYGIAPYYFYYGHRYVGQAIAGLPEDDRAAEIARFNTILMKTRDEDATWNDRVFEQSNAYGTAMAILGLLGEKVPVATNSEQSGIAIVLIDADGSMKFDAMEVSEEQLTEALGREERVEKVIIRVDAATHYGKVVAAMQVINLALPDAEVEVRVKE